MTDSPSDDYADFAEEVRPGLLYAADQMNGRAYTEMMRLPPLHTARVVDVLDTETGSTTPALRIALPPNCDNPDFVASIRTMSDNAWNQRRGSDDNPNPTPEQMMMQWMRPPDISYVPPHDAETSGQIQVMPRSIYPTSFYDTTVAAYQRYMSHATPATMTSTPHNSSASPYGGDDHTTAAPLHGQQVDYHSMTTAQERQPAPTSAPQAPSHPLVPTASTEHSHTPPVSSAAASPDYAAAMPRTNGWGFYASMDRAQSGPPPKSKPADSEPLYDAYTRYRGPGP